MAPPNAISGLLRGSLNPNFSQHIAHFSSAHLLQIENVLATSVAHSYGAWVFDLAIAKTRRLKSAPQVSPRINAPVDQGEVESAAGWERLTCLPRCATQGSRKNSTTGPGLSNPPSDRQCARQARANKNP